MKKIGAAEFRAHCFSLLAKLTPEGLIITKRGKPLARVIPCPTPAGPLIGSLREQIEIHGDILSTGVAWDADGQP